MFLYSPSVLEHHLVRSVHATPPRLAPAKQARIQPTFPSFSACVLPPQIARYIRYKSTSCAVGAMSTHHSRLGLSVIEFE